MSEPLRPLGNIEDWSADELEREIRRHNTLYWEANAPEISDYDYDRLVERLQQLAPDAAVLEDLGERVETLGAPVEHDRPMLSLDKCYGEIDLDNWAAKIEGDFVVMPKLDGIACSVRYDAQGRLRVAATRGTGLVGDDVTANVRGIRDVPETLGKGNIEVRGEVFMRLSVFERYKDRFANPRNLTAGAMKQKDAQKSAEYGLSFGAYDVIGTGLRTEVEKFAWLEQQGFPPLKLIVAPHGQLQRAYDEFAEERPTLDYEIDGVVFRANEASEQERLGATAHHPRWALAYKFQGESGRTTLSDVEWSVSRTGAITPVALIEPVLLSGATVTRASLHHAGYVDKLGLSKACEVLVSRRGGVIPNVEKVLAPGTDPLPAPEFCPSCGVPTRWEGDFLFCSAPEQCKAARVGEVSHWCTVTDMLGFGSKLLSEAYDRRLIRSIPDVYTVTSPELQTLERVGQKLADKLVRQVDDRRSMPVATFLRALGVPELGKHVSRLLAEEYGTLEVIRKVTVEELARLHTVGEIIARNVVEGLATRRTLIDTLLEHVTLTAPPRIRPPEGPLSGKSFVFTGKLDAMDRKDAQAAVRALGAETPTGVSATLSYLVVGVEKGGGKSSKQKNAEKHIAKGAPLLVLDEEGFLALLKQVSEGS